MQSLLDGASGDLQHLGELIGKTGGSQPAQLPLGTVAPEATEQHGKLPLKDFNSEMLLRWI